MNIELSTTTVPPESPPFTSKGHILNSDDCVIWLEYQINLIGWTYSHSKMALHLYDFDRLISCKGPTFSNCVKFASNIHAKCYIAGDEMLIGSFNLVNPTQQDLCLLTKNKALIKHMTKQFNQHWNLL